MRKLHLYKIYTPREVSIFILRKEKEIIALLEKKRSSGKLGRKIMGFWYVRGKEVIEIQKIFKEKKSGQNSIDRGRSKRLETKKEKNSGKNTI